MRLLVLGILAVCLIVGISCQFVQQGYGQQRSGGRTGGIMGAIGALVILSALFGNRGTDYKVVFGNFTTKDVEVGGG